jgi:signal transduction histidine kinase
MRTPLNAIVGWISILRHQCAEVSHFQEGLAIIERNTKAQVQLIDDLLDVSRIVSGKLRVEVRPCDLTEVINGGVGVMRAAAESRGITLHVRVDPSAAHTVADGVRLQQVVWNLVSNAVKFTPKGGRVDVALARDQSSVQIQVSDTGQGISPTCCPSSSTASAKGIAVSDGRSPAWAWGCRSSSTSWKRTAGRSKPPAQATVTARRSPFACPSQL